MSKIRPSRLITLIILFGIAFGLVWLSLKSVSSQFDVLLNAFSHAQYLWVVAAVIISILSHVLRGARWNILLEPTGHRIRPWASTACVLAGYFTNYGVPRMGEVLRCTLAYKYDGVPVERGIASVLVERVVDMVILLVIAGVALMFQFDVLSQLLHVYVAAPLAQKIHSIWFWIGLLGVALCALFLYLWFRKRKTHTNQNIFKYLQNFTDGLSAVLKLKRPVLFFLYSLGIWLCYYLALHLCFFALPETTSLGIAAGMVLLVMGTLGVIFSPGGLGAYPLILSFVLQKVYHISAASAVALPWISWGGQFAALLILGPVAFFTLAIFKSKKNYAAA